MTAPTLGKGREVRAALALVTNASSGFASAWIDALRGDENARRRAGAPTMK